MLAGLVLTGVVVIVHAYTHTAARLGANETGSISIEKGALVSTAARALGDIDNVVVQDVKVDVIPRGDTAVIDPVGDGGAAGHRLSHGAGRPHPGCHQAGH